MADDLIKKIENLLNSSTKLSTATRQNFKDQLDLLVRQGAELSRFQALYDSIGDSVDGISNSLNYIYESLKDSVNELQKQNVYLNAQKSALNKISDIAKEVLKIRRGESELDTKKLAKLRLETTERIRQLEFSKKQHDITTVEGKAAVAAIDDQISTANELYGAFDRVLEIDKAFNKELGLAPKILSGLDKALSKLGMPSLGIAEALSETKMLHQEADSTGQSINLWKTFSGKVKDNFTSILSKANLMQIAIGFMVDALITGDKATGDLAKAFNITYNEAANVREELIQIGNLSGNAALNARALQESMVAIGVALGSNAILNKEDLKVFTELREMAGYTNEELVGIQKLTLATGGNLKNNVKQFLGTVSALNAQNKLTLNEKQLLKEVANTSAAIKLSVGGTTEGLAKAAFQAKQFGINLEQADKIASSLLDFESSITNELSAELITGKNLNLEKARLLALNGDIAGASAEILKQVEGSAEFTKMNRIQQESLAKAVGMSREELAASLVEREALVKIGEKDADAAKKKFDLLVKEKGYAAAVAELGDEQYATQLKQQSIQERFNQSVEKLKEIFISIAEPILQIVSPLMDLITTILPAINFLLSPLIEGFSYIGKIVGLISSGIQGFSGWLSKGSAAATALKIVLAPIAAVVGVIAAGMIYASLAAIPIVGPALGAIAVVGMLGMLAKAGAEAAGMKFAKGGIVTGEINNATIGEAGPEAIIPLNSSRADKYLGKGGEGNTDNTALMNKLDTLISSINNLGNRPIHTVVEVDGKNLAVSTGKYSEGGTEQKINTYKIA